MAAVDKDGSESRRCPPMIRLRLPIGIQTFRTIREEGYYYVDKTPDVRRLVKDGTHYFLSRPGDSARVCFLTP